MTERAFRVVIADDHDIFCEGLGQLLAGEPSIEYLGHAVDGDGLLALMREHAPDIAVMDISMPGPGAEEIAVVAARDHQATRLIALTVHTEPYIAQLLLRIGVDGYVIKKSAFRELIAAIHIVADGGQYFSPEIAEKIAGLEGAELCSRLSDRERACLNAAARGAMSAQIAHQLGITERTVDFHMANAMRKLDARHRTEAVAKAVKLGLIDL